VGGAGSAGARLAMLNRANALGTPSTLHGKASQVGPNLQCTQHSPPLRSPLRYEVFTCFLGKGDKETFAYGMAAAREPYYVITTPPGSLGTTGEGAAASGQPPHQPWCQDGLGDPARAQSTNGMHNARCACIYTEHQEVCSCGWRDGVAAPCHLPQACAGRVRRSVPRISLALVPTYPLNPYPFPPIHAHPTPLPQNRHLHVVQQPHPPVQGRVHGQHHGAGVHQCTARCPSETATTYPPTSDILPTMVTLLSYRAPSFPGNTTLFPPLYLGLSVDRSPVC
jgi:hypothetical protein